MIVRQKKLKNEKQSRIAFFKALEGIRNDFTWKDCLHPLASSEECSTKVIGAHTVRRSADLKKIAEEGHVYKLSTSPVNLFNNNGKVWPELVGIKEASTFFGFCQKHDTETFKSLEAHEFIGSPKQCFLLAYRPLLKEIYLKKSSIKSVKTIRNSFQSLPQASSPFIQHFLDTLVKGHKSALIDLERLRTYYDECHITNNFNSMRSVIFYFKNPTNFVCSGIRQPEQDFNGNLLQNLASTHLHLDMITLSIICINDISAAVFAWHQVNDKSCVKFISSLLHQPLEKIPIYIFNFSIESFENHFLRPSWWDQLSNSRKNSIIGKMGKNTLLELLHRSNENYECIDLKHWNLSNIKYVNFSV